MDTDTERAAVSFDGWCRMCAQHFAALDEMRAHDCPRPPEPPRLRHGAGGYRDGCRCWRCAAAWREYARDYAAQRRREPPRPVTVPRWLRR